MKITVEFTAEDIAVIVGRHVEQNFPEARERDVVVNPREFKPGRLELRPKAPAEAKT